MRIPGRKASMSWADFDPGRSSCRTIPARICARGYPRILPPEWVASPLDGWAFNLDYAQRLLMQHFGVATLAGFGCENRRLSICAAGALVHYIKETQLAQSGQIGALQFYESSDYLKLDASTITNLELVQTVDGNRKGSLLSLIDQTRTSMGGRLLKSWLLAPLRDPADLLRQRQDAVERARGGHSRPRPDRSEVVADS